MNCGYGRLPQVAAGCAHEDCEDCASAIQRSLYGPTLEAMKSTVNFKEVVVEVKEEEEQKTPDSTPLRFRVDAPQPPRSILRAPPPTPESPDQEMEDMDEKENEDDEMEQDYRVPFSHLHPRAPTPPKKKDY